MRNAALNYSMKVILDLNDIQQKECDRCCFKESVDISGFLLEEALHVLFVKMVSIRLLSCNSQEKG